MLYAITISLRWLNLGGFVDTHEEPMVADGADNRPAWTAPELVRASINGDTLSGSSSGADGTTSS